MHEIREHRVTTDHDRMLVGTERGPRNGRPVLFVAGAATGKLMSFGDDLLDELGVRLLTMDRPGIGASTIDPDRTLSSTSEDYATFVEGVLGSDSMPLPVVANSQGGVFGLQLAVSGMAARLTLVSPADELSHPAVHAMLPAQATALSDLAQSAPEEAAAVLAGFNAAAMAEMVLSGSHPSDADFYRSEPFHARYRAALDEGFANHASGYVCDTLIAMRPWEIAWERIICPVDVLFGVHDLTHSPDHGATLAARIRGASRRVLDDAGGALLWTHARLVLESALRGSDAP